jgi:hypothetical protein
MWAKQISIYLTSIINFNYFIPFRSCHNTTKWKEHVSLKGTTFVYVLSSDWWASGLTPYGHLCPHHSVLKLLFFKYFVYLNIFSAECYALQSLDDPFVIVDLYMTKSQLLLCISCYPRHYFCHMLWFNWRNIYVLFTISLFILFSPIEIEFN